MKVLYFDCFAGISGDMTISSLLSHVDVEEFKKKVKKIALDNFDIEIGETQKNSISARTFKVLYEEEHRHHRHMKDVREIIEKSDLEEEVKKMSIEMFEKLAEAEAKVHGKSPEEVHFHEVGAVDSIVDIIGTAILIDMIKPDKIVSSPLPVSSGFIKTQHGLMPVPAPATAELLKGIPVYKSDIEGEIVTPTGASIVKTLVNEFGGIPDMTINSIGYGAGTKDLEIPNVLRTYVGEEEVKKKPESLMILETNIDDMNPEFYQYLFEKLFENGALDVFLIPIIMKKQRPGTLITVICEKENADKLKEIIFKETSTFGIRYYEVLRHKLDRDFSIVETPYGKVRVKKGYLNGKLIKAYPEYEDVKAIAEKTRNSISDIYRNVIRHIDLLFFKD